MCFPHVNGIVAWCWARRFLHPGVFLVFAVVVTCTVFMRVVFRPFEAALRCCLNDENDKHTSSRANTTKLLLLGKKIVSLFFHASLTTPQSSTYHGILRTAAEKLPALMSNAQRSSCSSSGNTVVVLLSRRVYSRRNVVTRNNNEWVPVLHHESSLHKIYSAVYEYTIYPSAI